MLKTKCYIFFKTHGHKKHHLYQTNMEMNGAEKRKENWGLGKQFTMFKIKNFC